MESAASSKGASPASNLMPPGSAARAGAAHAMHAIHAAAPRRNRFPLRPLDAGARYQTRSRWVNRAARAKARRGSRGSVETARQSLEVRCDQAIVDQLDQLAVEQLVQGAVRLEQGQTRCLPRACAAWWGCARPPPLPPRAARDARASEPTGAADPPRPARRAGARLRSDARPARESCGSRSPAGPGTSPRASRGRAGARASASPRSRGSERARRARRRARRRSRPDRAARPPAARPVPPGRARPHPSWITKRRSARSPAPKTELPGRKLALVVTANPDGGVFTGFQDTPPLHPTGFVGSRRRVFSRIPAGCRSAREAVPSAAGAAMDGQQLLEVGQLDQADVERVDLAVRARPPRARESPGRRSRWARVSEPSRIGYWTPCSFAHGATTLAPPASTATPITATRPRFVGLPELVELRDWNTQGGHQVAQKSITTVLPRRRESRTGFPSGRGAGSRAPALRPLGRGPRRATLFAPAATDREPTSDQRAQAGATQQPPPSHCEARSAASSTFVRNRK